MEHDVSHEPLEVVAAPGAVVILAPQGPVALSPMAALETSRRLLEAAQRVLRGDVEAPEEDG